MTSPQDPDAEIVRRLRLRAEPPPVVRLSRRTLALLTGVASVAIAAVAGWSLSGHRHAAPPPPAEAAVAPGPPAAVTALPKDYAGLPPGVPKLGPPLPGDLGRPFLEARAAPAAPSARPAASVPVGGAVPAAQTAETEARQARSSRLAVALSAGASPPPALPAAVASVADRPASATSPAAGSEDVSPARLQAAASPYLLQAGAVIRAALLTGIRADLPGEVVAQVTEDVFDSVSGRWKLIPQGSRLIGTYDDRVGFGQSRVNLVWTRLVLPDGRSLALEKIRAADPEGHAGLEDRVDRHWTRLAGAALVSSVLGVGAELGAGAADNPVVQALRAGVAGSANQAGQQLVGKSLDVPPTLVVRPGYPVRVLVAKDLVLEPWSS